eukprot:COSAG01_NODE_1088_length_11788_cov_12.741124_14_plen_96_part_00
MQIVEMLLKCAGTKIDLQNNQGSTPLSMAAQNGHANVVTALMREGANSSIICHGKTAEQWAQREGHHHIVRIIQSSAGGAPPKRIFKNKFGRKPS